MGVKCGKGAKPLNLQSASTTALKNAMVATGKTALSEVKQVIQTQQDQIKEEMKKTEILINENLKEFIQENGEKIEKVKKSVKNVLFSDQNEEKEENNDESEKKSELDAEEEKIKEKELEEERLRNEENLQYEALEQKKYEEERKRQEEEDAAYYKEQERLMEEERLREEEYEREREEEDRLAEEERIKNEGNNEGDGHENDYNNNNYDNFEQNDNYNNYDDNNYDQNNNQQGEEVEKTDQKIEVANVDAFFAPEKEKNLLEIGGEQEFEENNVFNHVQIDLNKELEIEENNKPQVFFRRFLWFLS